ncbi:MAG: AbrB family transcriptional regulator [Methylobacteriaceae bacterium]|nr:AbrB family transcriptional regulator [Methylobacteriaceae bacterium]
MQVEKLGDHLVVPLPASVVEALGLKEGDSVSVGIVGSHALEVEKAADRNELLARLRRFRGMIPADFKFDRLEANERR